MVKMGQNYTKVYHIVLILTKDTFLRGTISINYNNYQTNLVYVTNHLIPKRSIYKTLL